MFLIRKQQFKRIEKQAGCFSELLINTTNVFIPDKIKGEVNMQF